MTGSSALRSVLILPKGRFMKLLVVLLGMFVLIPLLEELFQAPALGELFFSAVFCYAAYSFNRNKRLLTAAVASALPAITAMWLNRFMQIKWLAVGGNLCGIVLLSIITIAILVYIFSQKNINADIIAGAIVAYLLMALLWSLLFGALEVALPGSFKLAENIPVFEREVFTYFSFVTITTVGYGDIVPATPIARAFANLEAVVGQLYLVILVSWLVGMYVSARSR
jgi:voltage-gated potassium channel